jgi:hypothetical protein
VTQINISPRQVAAATVPRRISLADIFDSFPAIAENVVFGDSKNIDFVIGA